jgi:virginiamycin B lyase
MIEPAQNESSMSKREQASRPESGYAGEVTETARPAIPHASHGSVRRRRDAWFLLMALLVGSATIVALSGGLRQHPPQIQETQSGQASLPCAQTQAAALSTTPATGTFHEYPLPQPNDGLMRLAIDRQGRLWFGEMQRNFLAVFDPRTRAFQQWTPPGGKYGIMGIQVAADDTIWFAEQYANYIGHYFPATGRYQLYHLPWFTVPDPGTPGKALLLPVAPNDLALDARGNVWFTELNAGALGRLDTHNGLIQHYPLADKKDAQALAPYGVSVDQQGLVWFTEMGGKHLGRLDPVNGGIRLYTLPGQNVASMEIASDARGTVWATTFTANVLLSLNPHTGAFTAYAAPTIGGSGAGGLYDLVVTSDNGVWVTVSADSAIARLDVSARRFTSYRIPTASSLPIGIVVGANHTLWFTEAGSDRVGMMQT